MKDNITFLKENNENYEQYLIWHCQFNKGNRNLNEWMNPSDVILK